MDIQQIMKKAQDLQNKMQKAQKELEDVEVTGSAGGDLVKVTLNGKGIAKKCEVDQTLMEDKGMLEDLVVAAFNNAKNKLDEAVNSKMQSLGITPDLLSGA